jgi:hypothetical protein
MTLPYGHRFEATQALRQTLQRAVPLQAIAPDALDRLPATTGSALLFPAPRGGYLQDAQTGHCAKTSP